MHKLQKEQIEQLKAKGFELINDGKYCDPYQDFYCCTTLTKTENLREGVTFNKDTGEFYAMLDIQSDYTDGCKEYGTSDDTLNLSEAFAWLEAAKKDFQLEIEAVSKIVHQTVVSV